MYAIVNHGGKQYKVSEGDIVRLDKLDAEEGSSLDFDEVLYISKDEDVRIGAPFIEKAKVVGEVIGDVRDKKIVSFFYRRRKSSSRKVGHRQTYSCVKIKEIAY